MKVILFNGPPRSGKDTVATRVWGDYLTNTKYEVEYERFSFPLKKGLAGFFDVPYDEFGNNIMEADKDLPRLPNRKTYRQAQISFSEDWAKKFFGPNIFGELMVERINTFVAGVESGGIPLILIPDSGFIEELEPIVGAFGPSAVAVVKMFREGCTYEGDSRSYLSQERLDRMGVHTVRLYNDSTPEDLLNMFYDRMKGWL